MPSVSLSSQWQSFPMFCFVEGLLIKKKNEHIFPFVWNSKGFVHDRCNVTLANYVIQYGWICWNNYEMRETKIKLLIYVRRPIRIEEY